MRCLSQGKHLNCLPNCLDPWEEVKAINCMNCLTTWLVQYIHYLFVNVLMNDLDDDSQEENKTMS
jgi:hypothetical protein